MKKEFKIIAILISITIGVLFLKKPVEYLLTSFGIVDVKNDLIAGIISRGLLIILLFLILKRYEISNQINLLKGKLRNFQALLLPLLIVILGINLNISDYNEAGLNISFLFFVSSLLIGFVEELLFRGMIFSLLIKALVNSNNVIYKAIFLSSFLFGMIHFLNLIRNPNKVQEVATQVLFAFSIGCFFCGLYLRVGNIIVISLLHGLLDFAFGTSSLKLIDTPSHDSIFKLSAFIFSFLIWSVILVSGFIMARISIKNFDFKKFNK